MPRNLDEPVTLDLTTTMPSADHTDFSPKSADTSGPTFDDIVVGAGVIGLAHAFALARRGRKVLVIERHARALGASVRNFGMIWPIGQTLGTNMNLALDSRQIWAGLLERSGIWHHQGGSLHVAHHDDEAQVLREFHELATQAGYELELLDARATTACSRAVNPEGLRLSLYSRHEISVDPREVIAKLPGYLRAHYGVRFEYGQMVRSIDGQKVKTSAGQWSARRVWLCTGDETQILYPEILTRQGMFPCKLQMLRTAAQTGDWKIGPHLAGGLTLRHYTSFAACPTLAELKARVAREMPLMDHFGIHVMASQNGRGELTIGDSHEYNPPEEPFGTVSPFNTRQIDDLIMSYLKTIMVAPDLEIAERWFGVYLKHPGKLWFEAAAEPHVEILTGIGGNGMTLSMGVSEQHVARVLGEASTQDLAPANASTKPALV